MEYIIKFTASNSGDTECCTNELNSWQAKNPKEVRAYLESQGYENVEVLAVEPQ